MLHEEDVGVFNFLQVHGSLAINTDSVYVP
jgi:hypothetical protein